MSSVNLGATVIQQNDGGEEDRKKESGKEIRDVCKVHGIISTLDEHDKADIYGYTSKYMFNAHCNT